MFLAAASVVVLLTLGLTAVVDAQSAETVTGRIAARLLVDGGMDLGFRPTGEDRILPDRLTLPADVEPDTWYTTSPIFHQGVDIGRINVRRLTDGRTELAFKQIDGERVFPRARHYPHRQSQWSRARIDRWVRTSEITIELPRQTQGEDAGSVQSPEPTAKEMEADILRALFGDGRGRSSGNDWGCPFTAANGATCLSRSFYESRQVYADSERSTPWNAYVGGHSGWDASHPDRNREFRSLTAGTVILAGTNLRAYPRTCNDIAVYDRSGGITTIYLHAEDVHVKQGQRVEVGEPLGTEGTSCATGAEHVHIEIRRGRPDVVQGGRGPRIYARGAGQQPGHQLPCTEVSIDPIPYLYRSATGRSVPDSSGWQRCDDGT